MGLKDIQGRTDESIKAELSGCSFETLWGYWIQCLSNRDNPDTVRVLPFIEDEMEKHRPNFKQRRTTAKAR